MAAHRWSLKHYEKKCLSILRRKKDRADNAREYERAKIYHAKMEDWYDKVKEREEVAEAKLFIALKDGSLPAFGRKLVAPTAEEHVELVDENIGLHDIKHEEIPAAFLEK